MTENEGNERLLAQSAWLQSLARSVVARRDLAQDVAQETLVVAWRRGISGVRDVRSWLAAILRRIAGKAMQQERRRKTHEATLPTPEPGASPADLVAKAAMQREVVDAVLRLDEPYRTTVLQRHLDEKSVEAIAAASGVPLETVRTRLRRGLQQLREDLDRRHGSARAWALPLLGIPGFDEALLASGTATATGVAIASAGVVTMSVQAKTGIALAAVCVGVLALQFWPSFANAQPEPMRDTQVPVAAQAAVERIAAEPETNARNEAAIAPTATTPVANAAASPWSASGRVIDEQTAMPVAGAEVRFTKGGVANFVDGAEVVRTGDDGTFRFGFLRPTPGFCELDVRHADYGVAHVPLIEGIAKAEAAGSKQATLGDVKLARGARMRGRVLAQDAKTVCSDAKVLHYRAAFGLPMQFFTGAVEVARCDEAGQYELPWRVAPGYRREWLVGVTDTGIGWRELQPSRRDTTNESFDIVLLPFATLQIRVVDAQGQPLPGANARMLPACEPLSSPYDFAREQLGMQPLPPFLLGIANADGRLVLTPPIGRDGAQAGVRVPGGRSTLHVSCAGRRDWRQQIDLQAGESRELTVRLVTGTRASVHGVVRDEQGAPIAGAAVRAGQTAAVAGHDGSYRCEDVDVLTGEVAVQVSARGFVAGGVMLACREEGTSFEANVTLAAAWRFRGVVQDQDGAPVVGAFVSVGNSVNTQTDAEGRFDLEGVPVATTHFVVSDGGIANGYPVVVQPVAAPVPEEFRIEVQRRRPGATLFVAVVDRATGRGLEVSAAWAIPLATDGSMGVSRPMQPGDGLCTDTDIPPGRYRLVVHTRDGRRGTREIEVLVGVLQVREQVALDLAGSARVRLDTSLLPRVPERLTVSISSADIGGLRVVGRPDAPPQGEWTVVLSPAQEPEVEVVGLMNEREFSVRVVEPGVVGDVTLSVAAGASASATLVLHPAGTLAFECPRIADFDLLIVHWRLGDGAWSSPQQLFACRGKQALGSVGVPLGTVQWRVGYHIAGKEPQRREGTAVVVAGQFGRVTLD